MKYFKKMQKSNIFIVAVILSLLLIGSLIAIMIIPNTNFALTTNKQDLTNTVLNKNIMLENATLNIIETNISLNEINMDNTIK